MSYAFAGLALALSMNVVWGAATVLDPASLLEVRARDDLSELLARHRQATAEEVVLAVFGTEDGRAPDLGRSGALLAIFARERRAEIRLGYGLESSLTPEERDEILGKIVQPALEREGVTPAAVRGVLELLDRLESPVSRAVPARARLEALARSPPVERPRGWALVALVTGALLSLGALCAAALTRAAAELQFTLDGVSRAASWPVLGGRRPLRPGGGRDGSW